jgi:inhibitor of KinA
MTVHFLPSGDTALTVEFGDRVERGLSEAVLRLDRLVREAALPGIVETVPTFRSLTVHFDPLVTDGASLVPAIERLIDGGRGDAKASTLWHVPACYAPRHAPDLDDVARRTGLDTGEVVRLHSGTRFYVYMLGFAPGYPYLGDLPAALVLPRRTDPRTRVPAGSIAIAAGLTAVYPVESPGGWHLIGTTPIRLFDPQWPRPALFRPGDTVHFEPIEAPEFDAIRLAVEGGSYQVPHESVSA